METFQIEISETLSRIIEVQASTGEAALSFAKDLYRSEAMVLDSGDFINVEITILG